MLKELCLATSLTVVAGLGLVSPAHAAADTLALTAFSLSSTAVQDVTTKAGAVGVTARITDSGPGVSYVSVTAIPADALRTSVVLKRTSGTAKDGIWTGSLPLSGGVGGVQKLSMTVDNGEAVGVTPEYLASLGFPSTVTTKVTAAPPAPPSLKVETRAGGVPPFSTTMSAYATWANSPAGKPIASKWIITGSGSCNTFTATQWDLTPFVAAKKPGGFGSCTITVRAVNTAGTSPASSGSAFLF